MTAEDCKRLRARIDGWCSDAMAEAAHGRERDYWQGRIDAHRDILALLDAQSLPSVPHVWECGCGAMNGVNLAACARCTHPRSESEI